MPNNRFPHRPGKNDFNDFVMATFLGQAMGGNNGGNNGGNINYNVCFLSAFINSRSFSFSCCYNISETEK